MEIRGWTAGSGPAYLNERGGKMKGRIRPFGRRTKSVAKEVAFLPSPKMVRFLNAAKVPGLPELFWIRMIRSKNYRVIKPIPIVVERVEGEWLGQFVAGDVYWQERYKKTLRKKMQVEVLMMFQELNLPDDQLQPIARRHRNALRRYIASK